MLLDKLFVQGFDLRVEIRDMLPHLGEHALSHRRDGGITFQSRKQRRDIATAFGHDDAKFRRMSTQAVDGLRPLPNQHLPVLHDDRRRLRVHRLHRHCAHARAGCSLADRLRVIAIILAALDERLHILRRDQLYPMAQGAQHPAPVMGAGTSFQSNLDRGQFGKEGFNLPAPELASKGDAVLVIDAM